jgi:hypothetical protein
MTRPAGPYCSHPALGCPRHITSTRLSEVVSRFDGVSSWAMSIVFLVPGDLCFLHSDLSF